MHSNAPSNAPEASSTEFPVGGEKFGIGLSWDRVGSTNVDLDLQAVAFDNTGKLLDAVYYNNLKALGRGLTHSGDETTGDKGGFDELIWVNFAKLDGNVRLIAFVVACHSGGHLRDAVNGKFHGLTNTKDNVIGTFQLESSDEEVDLIGALIRNDATWAFRLVEEKAQDGQHFIDILEPTIGNCVRSAIPGAPRRVKAAFAMDKGSVVDLPKTSTLKNIDCCLGWDASGKGVDLDVSAVLMDKTGNKVSVVFFNNESESGVTHSGDNRTGAGSGDDEVIRVELDKVAPQAEQIFFVINIYTRGQSFAQVSAPYCRVVTDGEEICRYQLHDAGSEQGLLIARLLREPGGSRWGFQAIGVPCKGNTWTDSMGTITQYAGMSARDLQRGGTTDFASPSAPSHSASSAHTAHAAPPSAHSQPPSAPHSRPPPPQKTDGCCVQ